MARTLTKEEFKQDKVYNFIYEQIKSNHEVPQHTIDNLLKNRDLRESTTHYIKMGVDGNDLYISFDTLTWIKDIDGDFVSFPVSITSITWYDDKLEYEVARSKKLFSAKDNAGIPIDMLN